MTNSIYLTVTALTKYIKRKFDADPHLRKVYVKGELSNVKIHSSGHIYFTLKDNGARIAATMFKSNASRLKFKPEEGMQVFIIGDVNVYEPAGEYRLYAQTMEPDGIGGLFVAFNQLKERLEKEGLFKREFKQPIPQFPNKVGVITATTGAAIRDICTTIQRRFPVAEIVIYPTIVQGEYAPSSIVENIQLANKQNICDVLIVGRGGGSIEDLWAFNEEIVARAIFESKIPIISAVGHETDTTISDYVSDLRAPTPTAAAELAVPNQHELYQRILKNKSYLHQMVSSKITYEKSRLNKLQNSYPFATPERIYRPFVEKVIQLQMQLEQSTKMYVLKKRNELEKKHSVIKLHSPKNAILYHQKHLEHLIQSLTKSAFQKVNKEKEAFTSITRALEVLNPLSVMNRGFTISYKKDQLIKSASQIKKDDEIKIQFVDGVVKAKVLSKKLEEKK